MVTSARKCIFNLFLRLYVRSKALLFIIFVLLQKENNQRWQSRLTFSTEMLSIFLQQCYSIRFLLIKKTLCLAFYSYIVSCTIERERELQLLLHQPLSFLSLCMLIRLVMLLARATLTLETPSLCKHLFTDNFPAFMQKLLQNQCNIRSAHWYEVVMWSCTAVRAAVMENESLRTQLFSAIIFLSHSCAAVTSFFCS